MREKVQKAIEDITYRTEKFPEEPFRIISENRELAIPYLNAAIEKAAVEGDELDDGYQLAFYALHLLGQFQERESFSKIMELVSLPSETLDDIIGDAVTSSLSDILYNTYNGDLVLLQKAVTDQEINEYARGSILKVMGQLYLDGELEKEKFQGFIRQIIDDGDEINGYIYGELIYVICDCQLVEMLPEIRRLFDDDRVDTFMIGGYAESIDMMFSPRRKMCSTPIDAADMLRGWAMFTEEEEKPQRKTSDKDFAKAIRAMRAEYTRQEKKVKIGRNDPCPCGSGKKYKKCCLNKPKQPEDFIESSREREKWLKRYPPAAKEREEGRIYLEDLFDPESIEIDQLLYLALNTRPHFIWQREDKDMVHNRQRAYLSEAFSKFVQKIEKENIRTFQEYDEKYSIHYQCKEWLSDLQMLLDETGDEESAAQISEYCEKMGI